MDDATGCQTRRGNDAGGLFSLYNFILNLTGMNEFTFNCTQNIQNKIMSLEMKVDFTAIS